MTERHQVGHALRFQAVGRRMYNVVKQCRHGTMIYNSNDAYIGRSLDLYGEFSQGVGSPGTELEFAL